MLVDRLKHQRSFAYVRRQVSPDEAGRVAALNLDGRDSDEVRRFVIDNALMWLRDYHFDGLRLDAVHAIVDQSTVSEVRALAAKVATEAAAWPSTAAICA